MHTKVTFMLMAVAFALPTFSFAAEQDAVPAGTRVVTYGAPRPEWSPDGVLDLKLDFSKFNTLRAFWDIPFQHDISATKGISFEYKCDDLSPIMSTRLFLKSGDGWYSGMPSLDTEGKWTRVSMGVEEFSHAEGSPAGLGAVSHIRLSCYNACKGATVVKVRNLKVERFGTGASAPRILLVRSDYSGKVNPAERRSFISFASQFSAALTALGLTFEQTSDLDISAANMAGKSLVILPYNPYLPKEKIPLFRDFVANGGKLLVAYQRTVGLEDLIGIKTDGRYVARNEGDAEIVGILRKGAGLPGQPEFAVNRAWSAVKVVLDGSCRVWATWTDADRRRTDLPAVVETPNGIFMTYVLTGGAAGGCGELVYSMIAHLVPAMRGDIARLRADRAAKAAAMQAEVDAMPGRAGERRLAWCHSPFGLDVAGDWEKSAQILERHGFTDVIACLAQAGVAFYESKVLPVSAEVAKRGDQLELAKAACHRHGVRLHAWKTNWVVGKEPESKVFYAAAEKEGRVVVSSTGTKKHRWLCPSDPHNQALEIASMTELAEKAPDGIHFDYIRYVDPSHCFCDKCRERFEKAVGRPLDGWPACVGHKGALAKEWTRFRCGNITRVVRETCANVRSRCKGVEISAAVFKNADHNPAEVGQDWGLWCREGLLDFVCPMDYTANCVLFRTLVRIQKKQHGKAKLYPGIGLSASEGWNHDDSDAWRLARQIGVTREEGLDGFTLFQLDGSAVENLPKLLKGPLRRCDGK